MSMKNAGLLPFLLLLNLAVFANEPTPPLDATDCTESFFQAMLDEDAAAIRRLITFDFLLIGPDGRILDGGTFSESVASGSVVIENGRLSGTATRTYGDAGVVTGFWNARGTVQGFQFDNELAFSATCVRQGGSWKVASIQLTARL
jgi:ketosteroid isomerase-like protein